jgi:hypothetical protein
VAEPTLTLTYTELLARVGRQAGYTRTSSNWDTEQTARVGEIIKDGLRRFYGEREWSFLKPWLTLDTVASQSTYELPDHVGFIEGNIFFDPATSWPEIVLTDAEIVFRQQQRTATTSVPRWAALRPRMGDYVVSQRSELVFWPTPDAAYTLHYKARVLPDMLTTDKQYALGARLHSQTILYACLAMGETGEDDMPGANEAMYQAELDKSKDRDARAYAGRVLGRFGNGRRRGYAPTLPADTALEIDQ